MEKPSNYYFRCKRCKYEWMAEAAIYIFCPQCECRKAWRIPKQAAQQGVQLDSASAPMTGEELLKKMDEAIARNEKSPRQ